MNEAKGLACGFKALVKLRKLNIDESTTWFLLLFLYAHGLAMDGLGFKFSGIIPVLSLPLMSLAMAFLCLVVSVLVLVAPLLPCNVRKRINCARRSRPGKYFRQFSISMAFILGLTSGVGLLTEKVPTFSWLIAGVFYVGLVIFLILLIKLVVMPFRLNAPKGTEDKCH